MSSDKFEYTTEYGHTIRLRAIQPAVLNRFDNEWKRSNPEPLPPLVILKDGDDWENLEDVNYRRAKSQWDEEYNEAIMSFMFQFGVLDNPPEDWVYPFTSLVESLDLSDSNVRRGLWVETLLGSKDYDDLPNLIFGINNATEQGIEEAKKNSTSKSTGNPSKTSDSPAKPVKEQ